MILGRRILQAIWFGLCAGNILLWPRNRFEWMLSEPGAAKDGLTFCTLPLDTDGWEGSALAIAPVLVTLAAGLFVSIRAGRVRPILLGGLALLTMWFMRFQLARWGC